MNNLKIFLGGMLFIVVAMIKTAVAQETRGADCFEFLEEIFCDAESFEEASETGEACFEFLGEIFCETEE